MSVVDERAENAIPRAQHIAVEERVRDLAIIGYAGQKDPITAVGGKQAVGHVRFRGPGTVTGDQKAVITMPPVIGDRAVLQGQRSAAGVWHTDVVFRAGIDAVGTVSRNKAIAHGYGGGDSIDLHAVEVVADRATLDDQPAAVGPHLDSRRFGGRSAAQR